MKNKLMRAAVILLALVLMTSCFVGGTFAKYVTSGNADDNARVAKFGVTVTAEDGAFEAEYDTDDDDYTGALSVEADVDVVAPGTSGNFATIKLSGTPEVAVEVAYEATVELGDKWVIDHDNNSETADVFYCPITITVDGTDYIGLDYSSATEFADAVEAAITGYTAEYAPGTDLSTLTGGSEVAISWAWNFETTDGDVLAQSDVADTVLGNAANATISITVDVTVTQID